MEEKHISSVSESLLAPLKTFPITVLLVDDQLIVAESLKEMLRDQSDIHLHYCSDPGKALKMAEEVKPTVILQDLVMPNTDGFQLVKSYKGNEKTENIPIIVLSSKEDPQIKADAFAVGADDYIVKFPDSLELIARIRYHSKAYILLLERNEAFQRLNDNQKILEKELADAADYVRSLLPVPFENGLQGDWRFIPSMQLGGDAFSYHWLDDTHFAIYLLDVCGHGVGAALHAISVMNSIRTQNLPSTDYLDPVSVLTSLNKAFPMDKHNQLFFTIWYGVLDTDEMTITYANGGHPPAILINKKTGNTQILTTPGMVIGAMGDVEYQSITSKIEAGDILYIFSDGVYEIYRSNGALFTFQEFIEMLKSAQKEGTDLDEIVRSMKHLQEKEIFSDDFSIIKLKIVKSK